MYLSFHPSLISGGKDATWATAVAVAHQAGYPAVDVDVTQIDDRSVDAFHEAVSQAGLRVGGSALPVDFKRDEGTFERDLALLPARVRVAERLGVTVMCRAVPASAHLPKREFLPVVRRRIQACARIAGGAGIEIGVEFHGPLHLRRGFPYEFMWRMDETLEFALGCGDNVGLLLDAWHWHHVAGTLTEIVDAGKAIKHVQVADAADLSPEDVRDDERLEPGAGVIDFPAFFKAVAEAGYTGPVSPEIFGFPAVSGLPEKGAARVRVALEALMSAATRVGCHDGQLP